jgi:hypothetical protein
VALSSGAVATGFWVITGFLAGTSREINDNHAVESDTGG